MAVRSEEYDVSHTMTFSDAGRYITCDGVAYLDAVDPSGSGREYVEGDLIPPSLGQPDA